VSAPCESEDHDPPGAAYAAALSSLPGMGPAALAAILRRWGPEEAWARVCEGSLARPDGRRRRGDPEQLAWSGDGGCDCDRDRDREPRQPKQAWRDAASRLDAPRWWAYHAGRGIRVTWPGLPTYPVALATDPQPPGVLFWRGSLGWLDCPCVALVGTRRASPDGRAVAFEMGRDLAAAGICVVSGLALGIDGAAHLGALRAGEQAGAAGPVGVAASGVDVAYPRRHAGLWQRVVAAGAVLSENLPGRPAQAWRFPSRNRVIAGLVRMVVVVESHAAGGSLITAEAAIARGIDVRVVPGPVHSPASAGSNQLLYDGPGPVRNAQDVLDGLGLFLSGPKDRPAVEPPARLANSSPTRLGRPRAPAGPEGSVPVPAVRPAAAPESRVAGDIGADARAVLESTGWRPTSINQIVDRGGLTVARTMAALDDLEARGLVGRHQDWFVRQPPS
jgi:DNA processing protein